MGPLKIPQAEMPAGFFALKGSQAILAANRHELQIVSKKSLREFVSCIAACGRKASEDPFPALPLAAEKPPRIRFLHCRLRQNINQKKEILWAEILSMIIKAAAFIISQSAKHHPVLFSHTFPGLPPLRW
ncbi:MAG: hypothetical protein HDS18_04560 [Bacteroides sp.]|nr:hypothetical protein [Bacteroides sp.]